MRVQLRMPDRQTQAAACACSTVDLNRGARRVKHRVDRLLSSDFPRSSTFDMTFR